MERFETKLKSAFDYSRFDPSAEMRELVSEFDGRYLSAKKEKGKREPISFEELSGGERKKTAPPKESTGLSRQIDKDTGKKR